MEVTRASTSSTLSVDIRKEHVPVAREDRSRRRDNVLGRGLRVVPSEPVRSGHRRYETTSRLRKIHKNPLVTTEYGFKPVSEPRRSQRKVTTNQTKLTITALSTSRHITAHSTKHMFAWLHALPAEKENAPASPTRAAAPAASKTILRICMPGHQHRSGVPSNKESCRF
eukprot:757362-Hanusia_phi.AAC.1